jgi:hypothetical protein
MSPDPARDVHTSTTMDGLARAESAAECEMTRLQRLVRSALRQGFCLDDPWRHAFLRRQWIGGGQRELGYE